MAGVCSRCNASCPDWPIVGHSPPMPIGLLQACKTIAIIYHKQLINFEHLKISKLGLAIVVVLSQYGKVSV